MAVIFHDERINPAEQSGSCSKHDAVSEQPVQRRADTEVHQVLHQNIHCILGTGEACFTHSETRLHEENERCSKENPDGVCCGECHTDHFHCRVFPN